MNPDSTKSCSNCGDVLELDEFPRDRSKADGRKSICRACDRAKAKAYYEANREQVLARASARYEERMKDVLESQRRMTMRRWLAEPQRASRARGRIRAEDAANPVSDGSRGIKNPNAG